MGYIRQSYGVPAKVGGRVEYQYPTPPKLGTIVGARGARLRIRLDGEDRAGNYHPIWMLTYLPAPTAPAPTQEKP